MRVPPPAEASGCHSSLRWAGLSLRWPLPLGAWALGTRASVVVAHRLSSCGSQALERRLSSCGTQAQLLRGMWDLPGPGLDPVSPALAGWFSTTVPPGKPYFPYSLNLSWSMIKKIFLFVFELQSLLLFTWYRIFIKRSRKKRKSLLIILGSMRSFTDLFIWQMFECLLYARHGPMWIKQKKITALVELIF